MSDLQVFESESFGQVRTVTKDGTPWFVAADVCRALNVDLTATRRLDADEKNTLRLTQGTSGNPNVSIVNESGLYSLVLGSRKPEAKAFKRWITHEVIPAIRKTGGYVNNDEMFVQTYLGSMSEDLKSLFRAQLTALRTANEQLKEQAPKVLFAEAVEASGTSILVGDLAKLIRQNGVECGQKRLFDWLREMGYLMKGNGSSRNMPTQKAMDMGLMEIKESAISNPDGSIRITRTPKITGKGQTYFVNRWLRKKAGTQ